MPATNKPSCKPQVSNAASFIRCPLRPAAHRKCYNYGSEFTRPAPELTNRARTLHACVVDIKPRGAKMKQCCNRQIEGSNWYILRLGVVRSVSRRTKAPSRVTIIGDSSANNSSYKPQYCTHGKALIQAKRPDLRHPWEFPSRECEQKPGRKEVSLENACTSAAEAENSIRSVG